MIVMFTMLYAALIIPELIQIYKDKDGKLFWIYTTIIGFSYIITILLSIGVKVPSPADPIKKIIATIFGK